MARSFVIVAFLVFALCLSGILARKEPDVEPSAVKRKAPHKAPIVGPKAPLAGPKAPRKAPVAGSNAPPKALVAGPKAPLKAPLTGSKAPKKAPVKAPFGVPKAPKKAPVKAPFAVHKAPKNAPVKAPFAVPKAPKKAGPKAPLAKPPRPFKVVGQIYCDPCRFEVMSKRSTLLEGVKVNLECRKEGTNIVKYVKQGITDANGAYKILVGGYHKGEICEVKPVQPQNGKCTEPMTKKSDRVVFTLNPSMTLIPSPLGFMTKAANGQCRQDDKKLN